MEEGKRAIKERFSYLIKGLRIENKKKELSLLEKETYNNKLWRDPKRAGEVFRKIQRLKKEIEEIEMIKLYIEEGQYEEADKLIKNHELFLFLSGSHDRGDAIFSIHAGQGGTEAMDWAEMLFRMYVRFFKRKNWKHEEVNRVEGEEAGIKSSTLYVYGNYAYGYLKAEAGVHRLVRLSPFNADKLRHTSFALVEVLPIIEEREVEIKEGDLEWQFFRSGGHGGQNVNKVSTAVRVIHQPTGLTVTCQTERYQQRNRENALKLLRSKLWQMEEEKRKKKLRSFKKEKIASWGKQIRSYVLHPYKLIKDLRTGYEEKDVDKVLDGGLDGFIQAYLRKKVVKTN